MHFDKIQKAKELVPYDEYDEHYPIFYFIALRYVGISLKETIRLVREELRKNGNSLDYAKVFITQVSPRNEESMKFLQKISTELINLGLQQNNTNYVKATGKIPKGNLGSMIWVEAIYRNPPNEIAFKNTLEEVSREIVNPDKH